ncbi:MAG: putative lipid II flippase FtsW [Patescibacteria group bacterium]|nr:putative lipid II flippase FtsW [bacterium]MDZ4240940.1 putative lipid II flippase FtsW [Patescibacteria group bacterium]
MPRARTDNLFFISVAVLVAAGLLVFLSASMGLWNREGIDPVSITVKQILIGLVGGIIACNFTSRLDYKLWRKWSPLLFLGSIILTLLVFVPGIGLDSGGARRWIDLKIISFQPSEFLKISFIIYFAALLSKFRGTTRSWTESLLPFAILSGLAGAVLVLQPDIDTFAVICFSGIAMLIVAGAKWRHIGLIILIGLIGIGALFYIKPYIKDRILTFLDPARDPHRSGYQIQQSLIAIGSGGLSGRGFGQSIQKFGSLPEPIGDSIFSVAAEEFGFIGTTALVFLYMFFFLRGLKIASHAADSFGRLITVGIVILIVSQSFLNISAMLGLFPLSGIPLLFISHGGTALFVTLAEIGIIFNVSKYGSRV